jgi:hypothetical protein
MAEHLYAKEQMLATGTNSLMELWCASFIQCGIADGAIPFLNHKDLYDTIDSTPLGGTPWQTFSLSYDSPLPDNNAPPWMHDKFEVWFQDPHLITKSILSNPDFTNEFDFVPFREFGTDGKQKWQNFMSGSWA